MIVAALAFCALATLLFALGPSFELVRSAVLDDLKDATVRQQRAAVRAAAGD